MHSRANHFEHLLLSGSAKEWSAYARRFWDWRDELGRALSSNCNNGVSSSVDNDMHGGDISPIACTLNCRVRLVGKQQSDTLCRVDPRASTVMQQRQFTSGKHLCREGPRKPASTRAGAPLVPSEEFGFTLSCFGRRKRQGVEHAAVSAVKHQLFASMPEPEI